MADWRDILERQQRQGRGAKVIDRLARDLRAAFPDMKGFSPRNLKYMRALAEAWPGGEFVQQAAAQLPWFHVCTLLDKLKSNELRAWYAAQTVDYGWSRNVLVMQIEMRLHERQGRAVTNFADRLPPAHSDLARSIGLLLCKENNRLVAEYALRGMAKPMGVAEYQLLREIPPPLTPDLPSIELIEAELASDAAGVPNNSDQA